MQGIEVVYTTYELLIVERHIKFFMNLLHSYGVLTLPITHNSQ